MNILFLAAANSTHTVRWVNALAERGNRVYLVYNAGHEPSSDKVNKKVKCFKLKYSGKFAYYLNASELRKIFKKNNIDIVNAHYASGYGTLARMARISPVILSLWGSDVYDFPRESELNRYILKKNVNYARAVASTSLCMAKELKRVIKKENFEITVTPFGVNLKEFDKKKYEQNISNDIIIGNVKPLEPIYGMDVLIEAVDRLKQKLVEDDKTELSERIKCYIYGEGSQRQDLISLIERKNLNNTVFLKGEIPNSKVPEALNEFSVFCSTSQKESFGVSIIEAMAMSIPIVATATEGAKEIISDEKDGYIVPIGVIDEIAEKIKILIINKEKCEVLGRNGREKVEKQYDWKRNVDIMEKLYNMVKERV